MTYKRETFISLINESVIKFELELSASRILKVGKGIDLNAPQVRKQIEDAVTGMFCQIQNNFNFLIKGNEK